MTSKTFFFKLYENITHENSDILYGNIRAFRLWLLTSCDIMDHK